MSAEPSRINTRAIPFPTLGVWTLSKEKIRAIEKPFSITKRFNEATLTAVKAVNETVENVLRYGGETTPLQNEILRRASHIFIERRLCETCAESKSVNHQSVNNAILGELSRLTESRSEKKANVTNEISRQDGIDLMEEVLDESSRLRKINTSGIAAHMIEAIANYMYQLSTDPQFNTFIVDVIVDTKKRRRVNELIQKIENQLNRFKQDGTIDLKKLVSRAEEIFLSASNEFISETKSRIEKVHFDLQSAFIPRKGTLAQGINSVSSQGASTYFDEPIYQQVDTTNLPIYFSSPPAIDQELGLPNLIQNLAQPITVATASLFYDLLTPGERRKLNLERLGKNLNPKEPRGGRNIMLAALALLMIVSPILTACAPQPSLSPESSPASPTPLSPLMTDPTIPSEYALMMSLSGRINFDIIGLLPLDPTQRGILYNQIIGNQISYASGIPQAQLLIPPEMKVGCTHCSDSRIILRTPSVSEGTSLIPEGILLDSANIGTQPTIYEGVNQSFFITHGACIDQASGCGALGGIKAILENPQYGRQYLIDNHVSELTISQLDDLIRQGATADPIQWAKVGARAQAEINFAANGTNHFVAYGFMGHADGSFQILGVVDALHPDQVFSIDDFPLLKGYSEYFNNPHVVDAALKAGQAPEFNVINGSKKFSTSALLGEAAAEPGVPFRVARRGTLTYEEAVNMVGGFDFSAAHLPQRGNMLTLVADNAQDMTLLRTALLNEGVKNGTVAQFLERGGVIVEMIPDEAGQFGTITIRRAEELGVELRRLDLMKSGLLSVTTRAQFLELAKANRLGSMLSEKQIVRLAKFYEVARPFLPYLKGILQGVGDYLTIKDVAKFVDEDLMGHELVYDYYPTIDNVIFAEGYNGYNKMLPDEYRALKEAYPGVSPYITSGLVQGISINQGRLSDAYLGAWNAWMGHGYGSNQPYSPWQEIQSANDLGKMLIITVPVEYPIDQHDFTVPPIKLYTSLTIKPAFVIERDPVTGMETARYLSFQPKTLNDDNSSMMLVDELTGLFTSLDSDDGPIQFLAVDENGFRYLMEAVPNLETKSFEFRFIAPLGPSF